MVLCEPQLGKRGLYPTINTKTSNEKVEQMMNLISYSDGDHSLLEIAELIDIPFWELITIVDNLITNGLLRVENQANEDIRKWQ